MSVSIGNNRAKPIGEIRCGIKGRRKHQISVKCPRNRPGGDKYRGRNKCWGCIYATWAKDGRPYGPWRPLP